MANKLLAFYAFVWQTAKKGIKCLLGDLYLITLNNKRFEEATTEKC